MQSAKRKAIDLEPSNEDVAQRMCNMFIRASLVEDTEKVECDVTLLSLLHDHIATAQDPLLGRCDHIDVEAVREFAAKQAQEHLKGQAGHLGTVKDDQTSPSLHVSSAVDPGDGAYATPVPSAQEQPYGHRRSRSAVGGQSNSRHVGSSSRGRSHQGASKSSARGRSDDRRRSGFEGLPSREDWTREVQRRAVREDISYAEVQAPKPNKRRARAMAKKVVTHEKYAADVVQTAADMNLAQSTKTGWAGKEYRYRTDKAAIDKAWREEYMGKFLVDKLLRELGFNERPVYLVDKNGVAYAFRADIPKWMHQPQQIWGGRNFLQQVPFECFRYRDRCGDRTEEDIKANCRGTHWYNVIGVDRQIAGAPKLAQYHAMHMEETNELLNKESAIWRLITYAESILRHRFPSLAERVDDCARKLSEQGWDHAEPMFGCWYNFCINMPRPGSDRGVLTAPHVDGKNLALMVCAIFVWGTFNSKEKAWLVLYEARVIVEIPVGVLFFFPSSLFIHFNINITALRIVTTADGSYPTPANSTPLDGVDGRGSIVFFNQASMFQLAELGCTVKQAKEAGKSSTCDNSVHVDRLPVP